MKHPKINSKLRRVLSKKVTILKWNLDYPLTKISTADLYWVPNHMLTSTESRVQGDVDLVEETINSPRHSDRVKLNK